MSNSKASLGIVHSVVDFTDVDQVKEALMSLLQGDNDLTENEEYFQSDTLELGFENEAERIVKEAMEGIDLKWNDIKPFNKMVEEVVRAISTQEYYGACEWHTIQINYTQGSLFFAYGGNKN